jgi:hypothetical protein
LARIKTNNGNVERDNTRKNREKTEKIPTSATQSQMTIKNLAAKILTNEL